MSGHEAQVVKVLGNHSYELDVKLLEQVLLKPEVKDLPVVVVSVAGAYRGGKSFLLNFFIRYLSAPISARKDGSWIGDDNKPLTGFNWRAGAMRNTTGILLWSEPFISTLANGQRVAVVLMDTQGTFDSKSTVRDNSTIFALSTLVSSVQIYNLSMNIQEDDMQHLQLFTSYGKMVQDRNVGGKAFQTLEFLVRDWPYPYDYTFGAEGGNRLIQQRLEVTGDQPQELKDLRNHIRSSFEEILCYLMPHPGFNVQNPAYKGNIGELSPDFRNHLKSLVPSLLSEEKMHTKKINGQDIKASDLFNYFKAYMTLFNSDEVPNPGNILKATVEVGLLSSMSESRAVYERGMEAECGPSKPGVPPVGVSELHRQYLAAARSTFFSKKTLATPDEANQKWNKLNSELEGRLPQFEQSNMAKLEGVVNDAVNTYESSVNAVHGGQPLFLAPQDMDAVHNDAKRAAMNVYDGRVRKPTQSHDQKRDDLSQRLDARLSQLRWTNDKNNRDGIKDVHAVYWRFMEGKSVNPPISDADFWNGHNAAYNQAVASFQAKRNRSSSGSDIYKDDLIKTINETFGRLHAVNQQKIQQENIRREQERKRIEQERIVAEQAKVRAEQERIRHEQEVIRLRQEQERAEAERRRIELENERLRQYSSSSSSSGRCSVM